jgi:uncharacterized protein YidB (DUF937 family)
MSFLDRFEGMVIGKAAEAVLDMVKNHPGDAHHIAERLQTCGLGHIAQSWAGPGANLNITVDQIQGVLAEEHVAGVATRLGISQQEAAQKIAELLPMVMSGVAENGRFPGHQ